MAGERRLSAEDRKGDRKRRGRKKNEGNESKFDLWMTKGEIFFFFFFLKIVCLNDRIQAWLTEINLCIYIYDTNIPIHIYKHFSIQPI